MSPVAIVKTHAVGRTSRHDRNCGQTSTSYSHVPLRRRVGVVKAEGPEKAVVTYEPKVREVAPPPKETPIMHSSAYLVKGQSRTFDFMTDTPSDVEVLDVEENRSKEDFSGNALEWALHKADEQLNQMENSSDGVSKVAMSVVKSPAGQVTLRTMQGFATVAAAAGPQLLKVAVPIGKQILKLGAQGLVGGVSALDAAKKQRDSSKTNPAEK